MSERVIVVTPPDDILVDAKRILLFDPTVEQTQTISQCLSNIDLDTSVIFYIWRVGNDLDWLLDKSLKYDLMILNAETQEQSMLGYLFSKPNSYYVGNMRSLSRLKNNQINDTDHLNTILKERIKNCE
jgi:hypothetical protein